MSEKQEQEKVVLAAVDFVAALLSQNWAYLVCTSPRGVVFELGGAKWEVMIEHKRAETLTVPSGREFHVVVARPELLRNAVTGGLTASDEVIQMEHVRNYRSQYYGIDWVFETIPDRGRWRVGGEASDNSVFAVGVSREKYPSLDDARAAAETVVELCNAFVARQVFQVYFLQRSAHGGKRIYERYYHVFGISHLVVVIIEALTKHNLLRPGHGLLHIIRVELEIDN